MAGLEIVLKQLKAERQRLENELKQLNQAISSLTLINPHNLIANARPTRTMSFAARKRIANAQKARWAKFREKSTRKAS